MYFNHIGLTFHMSTGYPAHIIILKHVFSVFMYSVISLFTIRIVAQWSTSLRVIMMLMIVAFVAFGMDPGGSGGRPPRGGPRPSPVPRASMAGEPPSPNVAVFQELLRSAPEGEATRLYAFLATMAAILVPQGLQSAERFRSISEVSVQLVRLWTGIGEDQTREARSRSPRDRPAASDSRDRPPAVDAETLANLMNFRNSQDISQVQHDALNELARNEGFAQGLVEAQHQTHRLPRFCFSWFRGLIMRALWGPHVSFICAKGDACKFKDTHRENLTDYSGMERLSYGIAILRSVYKPQEMPVPEAESPPSPDEDLHPELKINPKWLRNLNISKPGGERKVQGWTYNSWMKHHKDAALAAIQEKERLRQVGLLREWVKEYYHREYSEGLFDADSDEPLPRAPPSLLQPAPAPAVPVVQPPDHSAALPALRPALFPAPPPKQRKAGHTALTAQQRSRDRGTESLRDRDRDRASRRDRSRDRAPRTERSSDPAGASVDPTAEERIGQLQLQARLARAEAEHLEAQRLLQREKQGGTHGNRILDNRRLSSGVSDTASERSHAEAVTPPALGSARRSSVLSDTASRRSSVDRGRAPEFSAFQESEALRIATEQSRSEALAVAPAVAPAAGQPDAASRAVAQAAAGEPVRPAVPRANNDGIFRMPNGNPACIICAGAEKSNSITCENTVHPDYCEDCARDLFNRHPRCPQCNGAMRSYEPIISLVAPPPAGVQSV